MDVLFSALKLAETSAQAIEIENKIWRIWIDSGREDVNSMLARGIAAMNNRQYIEARRVFTAVIRVDPTFAEGWNKRATVHWLMGNVSDSMEDIRRTLILEPRHFGAISGMGLIFMERGDKAEALSAFEAVLKISPKSENAKLKVISLRRGIQKEAV